MPGDIQSVWLNDLTETDVAKLLDNHWLTANRNARLNFQSWLDTIELVTRQLWESLMKPVTHHLKKQHLNHATLIPTGYLSVLPLHAAWTEETDFPTPSRRYALDDIHITYVPNAQALTAAQSIADQIQPDSILAIDNPQQDLKNSEREVKAAINSFNRFVVLHHTQATVSAVKAQLSDRAMAKPLYGRIAHFSCHGTANLSEPLNSCLVMSDGLLTLKDIFALNLAEKGGLRLVILSACETGLQGIKNADEVISLPTGLLQAGVAAVISSLWSVSDLSTMILLTRFYDFWRIEGSEIPQALRQAQQWVRDTTNGQKYDYLKVTFQSLADDQQIPQHSVNELLRAFMLQYTFPDGPQAQSFAHPFHWAAFTYTGV